MDVETKVIALTTAAAALMIAGLTRMLLVIVPKVTPTHTPVSLVSRGGADNGATMSFPESPSRAREFSTRDFAGADLDRDGYLTPNKWKRAGQR